MDVAHNDGWRGGLEDVGLKFYVERHGTEDADAGFDDELELIFIEHSGLLKFFDDGLHIHLQQFPGWDSCSLQFRSLTFILHFRKYNKFGGEKSLEKQIIKDEIKTQFCINNSINLFRIRYDESIRNKLMSIFSESPE